MSDQGLALSPDLAALVVPSTSDAADAPDTVVAPDVAATSDEELRRSYEASVERYKANVQGTGGYKTRSGSVQDPYGPPESFEAWKARVSDNPLMPATSVSVSTSAAAPRSTADVITSEDPFGKQIISHESEGNPLIGWGKTDLSKYPLDKYGFPDWPGLPGPVGISTAAGLYGITKTNWHHYAPQVGVSDFSPESQQKVKNAILADQGPKAWTPHWRRGGSPSEASSGTQIALGDLGQQGNLLMPTQRGQQGGDSSAGSPAGLASPMGLLGLLAAGTHKIVPINYDPFRRAVASAIGREGGPVSMRIPNVESREGRVSAAPLGRAGPPEQPYITRTGMRAFYDKYTPGVM